MRDVRGSGGGGRSGWKDAPQVGQPTVPGVRGGVRLHMHVRVSSDKTKGESYCDAESTGENIKHPKLNKSHHKAERGDEQWGG